MAWMEGTGVKASTGGTRYLRTKHERGAVAVEFALIVPVVLVLLFGIIGFGIVFAQQLALGNAARQGARFGAVESTCGEIVSETQRAAFAIGIETTEVEVEVKLRSASGFDTICDPTKVDSGGDSSKSPCEGSSAGDSLYVRTTYVSSLVIPFSPVDEPDFVLKSSGEFRCEYS
jgi:hypothetical protein